MRRYALRDDQWDWIKEDLPGCDGPCWRDGGGQSAVRRKSCLSSDLRAGVPWRDLPGAFWRLDIRLSALQPVGQAAFSQPVFRLATITTTKYMMIDATIVRAHQHSAVAETRRASHSAHPAAD